MRKEWFRYWPDACSQPVIVEAAQAVKEPIGSRELVEKNKGFFGGVHLERNKPQMLELKEVRE
jgi:hypothetical protein